ANSAPGPDGITIALIKRCPTNPLEVLFNIILYRRMTPTAWKTSRTVLIPITIGPALQRLLHRVLAKRLGKAVPPHPAQRGFISIDGTLANLVLLEHYIKARRLKRKSYNSAKTPLDLGLQDYIKSTLADAHITISVGGCSTRNIQINSGVKQGDPLSPFLFNDVLDELIGILNERQPGGTLTPECRVSAMAFADDILLLEDRDLDSPALTGGILQEGDRLIRRTARRILHLNVHTGSQFLHARIRDGGLGLVQLRYKLPVILLRRLDNLRQEMGNSFQHRWTGAVTLLSSEGAQRTD
ncbi:hypothetical protein Trydic_g13549, partial [Trypoxylus dichotomus]